MKDPLDDATSFLMLFSATEIPHYCVGCKREWNVPVPADAGFVSWAQVSQRDCEECR